MKKAIILASILIIIFQSGCSSAEKSSGETSYSAEPDIPDIPSDGDFILTFSPDKSETGEETAFFGTDIDESSSASEKYFIQGRDLSPNATVSGFDTADPLYTDITDLK